jgi:hypothetical protein
LKGGGEDRLLSWLRRRLDRPVGSPLGDTGETLRIGDDAGCDGPAATCRAAPERRWWRR